jgi:quercetin dioxygenase-like cupin family protein
MTAFPDLDSFAALYPEVPGIVQHTLANHPMFALDALANLAARLDPATVEYNRGDLPTGVDPDAIPANGLSVGETIRGIETNKSWMVLKFVERDPAYGALLKATLDELLPVVRPRTGAMHQLEAFIFLSSPNSVTPLHFDPEHNILLQLRGSKTMTVFPQTDTEIAPGDAHERFYQGLAHRNLPWRNDYAARGRAFTLHPGDGMFVPVMAPHWVKNGPDVSISFSVTWRSDWTYAVADAHALNAVMRKRGLNPAFPGRYPAQNRAKALAWRALRRIGVRP